MTFTTDFTNSSKIIAAQSSNYHVHPQYHILTPIRAQAFNWLYEGFDTAGVPGWNLSPGGSSTITTVPSGSAEATLGNAVQLHTGATLDSYCAINRSVGLDATKGGMHIHFDQINPSSDFADMFNVSFGLSNGKMIQMLFNANYALVNEDGTSCYEGFDPTVLGEYYELWPVWEDVGSGLHKVDLYLGTVLVHSKTFALPPSTIGTNQVHFHQRCGATPNRCTRIAFLAAGPSQLPSDMDVTYQPWTAPYNFTRVHVQADVEDIAGGIVWNTDHIIEIKVGAGAWTPITMTPSPTGSYKGAIDWTKDVTILTGEHFNPPINPVNGRGAMLPAGTTIQLREKCRNNKLSGTNLLRAKLTSDY